LGSFQLLDIYGNSVTASLPPFETLFDADTTLPNLVALSPGDGQTGLPLNAQIIANFDKPIDPTSFGGIQLLAGSTPVPLVLEPNEFNRVRFAPVDPLVPNTTYTVVVSGVKDLSGNVMAGTVTRSFVTGAVLDSVPPNMLTLLNPAPNLSIRFVFSKPVSPATVDSKSLVLSRASNNLSSWFWIPVSATVSLSADGLTATLTPNAPLTPNWRHEVVALNIRDFAGNSLSSSSTTHEDFSTSSSPDVTAPVIAVTPPDASTGVPLTTPIAAITLETVLPPPSSPAALQLSTGGQPVPGAVSFDGRGLTFTPSSPLLPGTTYRMDVVSLTDLAGNASAPVSSTFTTAATGSAVAPYFQLVSSSPANGDAGVDSNAPIVLTFNSPINAATMNYIGILTPFPTPGIFTASGNTVTFTPSEPWGSAVAVGIRMNTYVQNLYGTPLPYMNIGFLTVATSGGITPQLLSTSPPVGSTLVPTQGDFRLTFNETVAAPTGAMIFFNGSQQTAISPTYDVNDFHTLTFSAGISANSQVTITGSDAIADRFGNPIVPFTLQYATGPLPSFDGPSVAQVSPVRQAQNVNPATPIVLQFNDSLDPQSALASIRVTQNGVAITGQLVLSNANQTVQFTPDQPYSPGARIDVLVLETLVDATGITYGGHYDSWFTVAGGSSAPAAASQVSFGSMVAPTAALELAFDQPLDGSTATSANVWLRSGHRVIPAAVSLRNGGRIVRLIPAAPLDEGSSYALTVGPGLLTTGGAQVRPEEFHFEASTADKAAEVESAVMETVGQIPAIHLHFAAPVSPLSADAASLIRADGTEAAVTRRISVDCMDLWLIPGASEPDIQALSVSLTGLEDRAGRPVARWKGAIVTRKSQ
jgi:methionine-rich copper-binding protein CopC